MNLAVEAMTDPSALEARLADADAPVEAVIFRLLCAPSTPADAARWLARLEDEAPGRKLGWLIRARLARRAGDWVGAQEAIARFEPQPDEPPSWTLERALVAAGTGDLEHAVELLDPLVALRTASTDIVAARSHLAVQLDDAVTLAALEKRGASADGRVRRALAMADAQLARGEVELAWRSVIRADEVYAGFGDPNIGWLRAELATERARLAFALRDEAQLQEALVVLRAVREGELKPWAAADVDVRVAVVDALLAHLRGDPTPARRLRQRFDAMGGARVPRALIADALEGRANRRLDPWFLP